VPVSISFGTINDAVRQIQAGLKLYRALTARPFRSPAERPYGGSGMIALSCIARGGILAL